MTAARTFLGRLGRREREGPVDGVVRNLWCLFNTKKRCGSVLAEYGLGDFERACNTRDAVELLRGEMLELVRRFEPRLEGAEVVLKGHYDVHMVRFAIEGTVAGARWRFRIDMNTRDHSVAVTPERLA